MALSKISENFLRHFSLQILSPLTCTNSVTLGEYVRTFLDGVEHNQGMMKSKKGCLFLSQCCVTISHLRIPLQDISEDEILLM